MTCVLGCDPGLSGAIAFYFPATAERVAVYDTPVAGGEIDAVSLAALVRQYKPDLAIIEQVASMPKQGVSSTFKFGMAFGVVKGVIATIQIPTHFVTPGMWKKYYRLRAEKEESRKMALRLWPECAASFARKKDHGKAEAALLARYGALVHVLHINEAAQ